MPPRHAYWTILVGDSPTAFRAADRADLLPTFERLKQKQPDVVLKWFARGQLWESQEAQRAAEQPARPPADRERRGPGWRPGGSHRDPRDRFKPKPREDRERGARPDRSRPDRPRSDRPRPDRPLPDRPPPDRPREDRPPRDDRSERSSRPPRSPGSIAKVVGPLRNPGQVFGKPQGRPSETSGQVLRKPRAGPSTNLRAGPSKASGQVLRQASGQARFRKPPGRPFETSGQVLRKPQGRPSTSSGQAV
jgi:hypothetical protein